MKTIDELKNDETLDYTSKMQQLQHHGSLYQRALDILQPFNVVTVSVDAGGLNVGVTGDRYTLQQIWGGFRRLGLKTSERPVKGLTTFNAFWNADNGVRVFLMFSSISSALYCTASTTMNVTWQRAHVTSTVRCDSACFSMRTSQLSRLRAQAGQL